MEKKINTKALLIGLSLFIIITLTIAFASLARQLKVAGQGTMDPANFDIHFINLSNPEINGGASVVTEPVLANKGASINDIEVNLKLPGDSITYTVDIVNTGDINAKISNIEKEIDCNQMNSEDLNEIFEFSVYYTDTETQLQLNDELQPSDRKNITIKIKYKDIEDPDLLPSEALTIDLSYSVTYEQSLNRMVEATYESGLPKLYTPVEYLESTGTQYIDTGVTVESSNFKWIVKGASKAAPGVESCLLGAVTPGKSFELSFWGPRILFFLKYSNPQSINTYPLDRQALCELTIEFSNSTRTIKYISEVETLTQSGTYSTNQIPETNWLLGSYNGTSTQYNFVGKIYSASLYNGTKMAFNGIPVLDSNNVPCVYDTVSKRPYYNQGTGEFLYPTE